MLFHVLENIFFTQTVFGCLCWVAGRSLAMTELWCESKTMVFRHMDIVSIPYWWCEHYRQLSLSSKSHPSWTAAQGSRGDLRTVVLPSRGEIMSWLLPLVEGLLEFIWTSVLTDACSLLFRNRTKLLCSLVMKAWGFVLLFQAVCVLIWLLYKESILTLKHREVCSTLHLERSAYNHPKSSPVPEKVKSNS